eukprot:scaffold223_cov408-Prasinococcus_capsulatus_cf.AAC.13
MPVARAGGARLDHRFRAVCSSACADVFPPDPPHPHLQVSNLRREAQDHERQGSAQARAAQAHAELVSAQQAALVDRESELAQMREEATVVASQVEQLRRELREKGADASAAQIRTHKVPPRFVLLLARPPELSNPKGTLVSSRFTCSWRAACIRYEWN